MYIHIYTTQIYILSMMFTFNIKIFISIWLLPHESYLPTRFKKRIPTCLNKKTCHCSIATKWSGMYIRTSSGQPTGLGVLYSSQGLRCTRHPLHFPSGSSVEMYTCTQISIIPGILPLDDAKLVILYNHNIHYKGFC